MSRTIDEWGDTYKAGYKTGHASRDAEVEELNAKLTEAERKLSEIYATEPLDRVGIFTSAVTTDVYGRPLLKLIPKPTKEIEGSKL